MNNSIKFQLGGANRPKITSGGSSNTTLLNRYFDALSRDISVITYDVLDLVDINQDLKLYGDAQAEGFQSVLSSIESRIAAINPTGQVLADPGSTSYIHSSNTSTLSGKYSQATLPISSTTNLLVYNDVYGTQYIPEDIKVVWGSNTTSNSTISSWNYDENVERALLGTGPWVRPYSFTTSPSVTNIWIKIELPFKFQSRRPNVLEFIPIPVFSHKLLGVYYSSSINEPFANWTAVDTTYLPGYNPDIYSNNYVNNVGPTRVFLPDATMSAIIIGFQLSDSTNWGLSTLTLSHTLFETEANYVVQNPYGSISSISILGKDPSDLANLSQSISTNTATVQLGTTDPSISPVITGVIMETSA